MAVGRPSSPAPRRLALLAALPLALTAWPARRCPPRPRRTPPVTPARACTPAARAAAVQQKVETAYAAYEESRQRVEGLSAQAARLAANAEKAADVASQLREQVSDEEGGIFHAIGDLVSPGESDVDRAAEAAADAESARQLSDMVQADPRRLDRPGRARPAEVRGRPAQAGAHRGDLDRAPGHRRGDPSLAAPGRVRRDRPRAGPPQPPGPAGLGALPPPGRHRRRGPAAGEEAGRAR